MMLWQRPEQPRPNGRWKHGAIPLLGLIGGIGGGKSLAASLLASRGAAVIDADAVGHEVLEDPSIRGRVVGRFGAGILAAPQPGAAPESPPRISRRALGAIVFADASALQDLEAILHPAMRARFESAIERSVREGGAACIVLDAAVLLEAGWDDLCDRIVYVDAPRDLRLRRVNEARGWSEETFAARERAQWPCDEKRRRADAIITNDGDPERLRREVDRLLDDVVGPSAPPVAGMRRPSAGGCTGTDTATRPIGDHRPIDSPATLGRTS